MFKRLLFLIALACAQLSAGQGSVLGKLGQALERTSIFSSMSTHSRVYYKLKPYQYLVVQDTNSSHWYRVLLQNGAYGYVVSNKVAKLKYNVTKKSRPGHQPLSPRLNGAIASRSGAAKVVQRSMDYLGTPYVWGGDDLNNGIDCSGFVKKLYGGVGVDLPRTAAEQALVGTPIRRLEDLQPGDRLYFWEKKRGKIGHTGIYMGGGYFVHSSRGHNGVATDYLGTQKWLRILVAARR